MSHQVYIVNCALDLLIYLEMSPKPSFTKTYLSLLYFTLLASNIDPGTHQMLCYGRIGLPTDCARGGIQSKTFSKIILFQILHLCCE